MSKQVSPCMAEIPSYVGFWELKEKNTKPYRNLGQEIFDWPYWWQHPQSLFFFFSFNFVM
jgi:hypothetical protein